MELLAKLLGGQERVKIMRLFLHDDNNVFSLHDISNKTKSKSNIVRKELTALSSIGFLEKKKGKVIVSGGKKDGGIKEAVIFRLNKDFPHNQALKELLFDFELLDKKELSNRFKLIGRIKLFVVSGVFIGDPKSRVDILIVGEAVKRQKAEKIFDLLSAELGRDVVYSIMDVEEYEYRYKMYDKFVRDILDSPHEKMIDKLSVKQMF